MSRRIGYDHSEWRHEWAQNLDDVPMALSTERTPGAVDIGGGRVIGGRGRSCHAEQVPRAGDRGAPVAIGEEPEVPDAHEAAREDV